MIRSVQDLRTGETVEYTRRVQGVDVRTRRIASNRPAPQFDFENRRNSGSALYESMALSLVAITLVVFILL